MSGLKACSLLRYLHSSPLLMGYARNVATFNSHQSAYILCYLLVCLCIMALHAARRFFSIVGLYTNFVWIPSETLFLSVTLFGLSICISLCKTCIEFRWNGHWTKVKTLKMKKTMYEIGRWKDHRVFQKKCNSTIIWNLKNCQNLSTCNIYNLKVKAFFFLIICSLDILMELFII